MVDALIVIFRFPLGVLASAAMIVAYVAVVLPISTAIFPFAFLVASALWSRMEIQRSWLGDWPFVTRFREDVLGGIWRWVFHTEEGIW